MYGLGVTARMVYGYFIPVDKSKFGLCLINYHAMKTYWGVEV
jgi:hypothetical protein